MILAASDLSEVISIFTSRRTGNEAFVVVCLGTAGNAVVGSYLWGKDVLLAWVPPRPGIKIPAFGYEFVWSYGGTPMITDRWREDKRASDLIRVRRRYDLKIVGYEINPASGDFQKCVTGYLIKGAIA